MIEVISPTPSAAGMLNVICIPAVLQAGNAKPTPIPMSANGIAICATVVVGVNDNPIHANASTATRRKPRVGYTGMGYR
jgi:hypothetical protein